MNASFIEEVGYVFLYVAAFGFSDFFVKKANLTNSKYLLYYFFILLIGLSVIYKIQSSK